MREDYFGTPLTYNPSFIQPLALAKINLDDISNIIGSLKSDKISEVVSFINAARTSHQLDNLTDHEGDDCDPDRSLATQRPKRPKPNS
jgi:hypothetical protein